MPKFFRVTYDIVTPESAERGDTSENGFAMPGGWRTPIESALKKSGDAFNLTLSEARNIAWPIEDSGSWFTGESSTLSYQTGEEITYALHPPRNISDASHARVKRALGIK